MAYWAVCTETMPLYEYECDSCGHRFEVIQKFSDPLVKVCPKCGCKVEKLLSSPAIQFKGSGFYINDYARKGSSEGSSDKSSEKPAETAKVAAKSDDKSGPSSSNAASSSGSTDTASASTSSKQS
jgi:putative FmdB family regulatory protein